MIQNQRKMLSTPIRVIPRQYPVAFALVALSLAVYSQVMGHPFISYDDPPYITENPIVREGLTKEGIIWAFTTMHEANWHPLTWLSHMADVELFGLSPGGHHLVNLLLHIANTVLLFLVLFTMSGKLWRSGFVAALFAVHPLHVESVAWVAERKDVLSAFFWILSMWAYARYASRGGAGRYFLLVLSFTLGLLSKPMVVTLPFVLLLLDYWPLKRVGEVFDHSLEGGERNGPLPFLRLVREKAPLLGLSLISCVVTYLAQQRGGAVTSMEVLPLGVRVANAVVSYAAYLGKALWPGSLSVYYPYPFRFSAEIRVWKVAGAVLALGGLTFLSLWWGRRHRYLPVGWFWYLGTLVPVIGFVQVGGQAMADRYTYVPLIGMFLLIAWGVPDLLAGWRWRRYCLGTLGGFVILAFSVVSWMQAAYWKSNRVLFEHALAVTPKNWLASNHLGLALVGEGKIDEGLHQFEEVLKYTSKFSPVYTLTLNNLGAALLQQGRLDDAMGHFRLALWIDPDYLPARRNLAYALQQRGDTEEEAIARYREILQTMPGDQEAVRQLEKLEAKVARIRKSPGGNTR
jgi:hypothetical protein